MVSEEVVLRRFDFGDDEIASKQLTLKRLADGVQEKIAEGELLEHVAR